ncbi:MAG: UvrD-helicase domain-containing protein [Lentisphaeria bacterium]|nr:UvrD-helicase domain-containing protein [Lentisphaeria bacterium]
MAKRVFLGNDRLLPESIAAGLAQLKPEELPDFGRILLVLPGKVARSNVQRLLPVFAGRGVLLPQMLTPHLLLHYGEKPCNTPDSFVSGILWAKALAKAASHPERYSLIFPDGKIPGDRFSAAGVMHDLRHELSAGGFSIGEVAEKLGSRGGQLAALEKLYCRELAACGYDDPVECDRIAAAGTAAFAGVEKVILAGIPDLPRPLQEKLAALDREYPQMVEIWIGDAPENEDHYDQWGVPVPEIWENKSFQAPLETLHLAADPVDAARRAILLASSDGEFDPDRCAIVLSDPSLYPDFAGEFSRLTGSDGKNPVIADPAGVVFSRLRLWKTARKLLDYLKNDDDFFYASELIRERDFTLYLVKESGFIRSLLIKLDDFQQQYMPDTVSAAGRLTAEIPQLKYAIDKVNYWKGQFEKLSPAEFLKKFFTEIYLDAGDIGGETVENVSFDTECRWFTGKLTELTALPAAVTAGVDKLSLMESFLLRCGEESLADHIPENAITFEGRLEMPFLTQKRMIFCGMNEKYFPDKIDITPFLTDSLRREIGIRSNRETLVRSLCHLTGVSASRQKGDVHLIVLREDREKSVLRPSALLFGGNDLSAEDLLARSTRLFREPEALKLPPPADCGREFHLHLSPEYRKTPDGRLLLRVTDLDEYLNSPFDFYWHRVLKCDTVDYEVCEPDARISGIFCHRAFELLGKEQFPSVEKLRKRLLDCFESALTEFYGELPVMVKLAADNMRQRLEYAAEKLFSVRQEGYEVLANEYRFGGDEVREVEFAGAVFRGSIDLIEYNRATNTLRIVDIKTGKVDNVVREHCTVKAGDIRFTRLQLPLYAILLCNDPAFYNKFGIDPAACRLECAYMVLPRSVTDTAIQVWDADDLAEVLPAARECVSRLICEIKEFSDRRMWVDPHKITGEFFRPDAAAVVRGIQWQSEESETVENAGSIPEITVPDAGEKRKFPVLPDISPAGNTRCCDCPAAVSGKCGCFHGDCSNCKAFNGFKSFNIITASAGTGKTYSLASRFIQLLSFGVKPENILAITFTRKAAGEIFDRIVRRMREMIEFPDISSNRCLRITPDKALILLRELLASSKELQISTIDSFFMRLLQSFAPELGIWGGVKMIGENDDRLLRKTLRKWIFSADEEELNVLRELLKDANASEQQSFYSSLQMILSSVYSCFLLDLYRESDGSLPQIENLPWYPSAGDVMPPELCAGTVEILLNAADDFDSGIPELPRGASRSIPALTRRLRELAAGLKKSESGFLFGRIGEDTNNLFQALFDNNPGNWFDASGDIQLQYVSKITFDTRLSGALIRSYRHIRALSFLQMLRKGRAIFSLIAKFDRIYARNVRNAGNLTFTDLPALLLSMDPETREMMLGPEDHSLEFRLDAKLSHYMFDEFQDTSDAQFMAFDPLLKELFSTAGSEEFRSFFCVGDIKQSIYQWRGGNPELFNYISGQLRCLQDKLGYDPADTLTRSYRSSQVILNTVNALFADASEDMPYFNEALQMMHYLPHISAKPDLSGHAAVLEVKPLERSSQNIPAKAAMIANILHDIQPFRRGLTVGVLVQTNRTARALAEQLRKNTALPVSVDGNISPVESVAFQVFRQLLILAEHPGDIQAGRILDDLFYYAPNESDIRSGGMEMLKEKLGFPPELPLDEALRQELFYHGLGGFAARFAEVFGREGTAFDRRHLEIMRNAAERFDGTPGEFLRQIEFTGETGRALENTIQVMTCHKSKGLEFDIVFLPDTGNRRGNHIQLTPESEIFDYSDSSYGDGMKRAQWVAYMPPDIISQSIDPYRENREKSAVNEAFAKCCNLYVAMTRAKRALYILLSCSKSSTSLAMDKLIQKRLPLYGVNPADRELEELVNIPNQTLYPAAVSFSAGDRLWYAGEFAAPDETAGEFFTYPAVRLTREAVHHVSAEGHGKIPVNPVRRFEPGGNILGDALHELLEKTGFIDDSFDAGTFCRENGAGGEAAEIFCDALQPGSPVREALRMPENECELWREKRFALFRDGNVNVSGAFDRVVIFKENGKVCRAVIYDYKSDRFKDASQVESYRPQMASYRKSLAGLLQLPPESVECHICALRLKEVIRIF